MGQGAPGAIAGEFTVNSQAEGVVGVVAPEIGQLQNCGDRWVYLRKKRVTRARKPARTIAARHLALSGVSYRQICRLRPSGNDEIP